LAERRSSKASQNRHAPAVPASRREIDARTTQAEWDQVAATWPVRQPVPLWRLQSDTVNSALVRRWLPSPIGRVLKTDLFDEYVSDGLYAALAERGAQLTGMDASPLVADNVRERFGIEAVSADVRDLPFADGSFDAVLSNSTLDHFRRAAEVELALGELARVLRPGGRLVLTLDNPINPIIALRNRLPSRLVHAVRRVAFEPGWTCGPRRARRMLEEAGLRVGEVTAVLHAPRTALAAIGAGGGRARSLALRIALAAEGLERLPTRFLTGHYVALEARRPG
jgi:SAM-dependent methyltransferase